MQFRHLRYFVKVVEAGSFSRAAAAIHVAQPALSQQVGELEERLGFLLLERSSRGVRPTAAGEVVFREGSEILRQLENLPGIVRSSSGEAEGTVSLGMATTLAGSLAGPTIEACRNALPKVTLRFSDHDSETLQAKVEAHTLDMAIVFEDEFAPIFSRRPLFRQRFFLIRNEPLPGCSGTVSLDQIATLPLVLPGHPNQRRNVIDRAFAAAGLTPNVVTETDAVPSELSAVRTGVGSSILNSGNFSHIYRGREFADPLLIEPPLFMTCSVISSSDFPLTHAGEAVKTVLVKFIEDHIGQRQRPGADLVT